MAYATVDELKLAMNMGAVPVSAELEAVLQACLDAAAEEIEHHLDVTDIVEMPPGIVNRTNVNRAVEWYKAPSTFNGGVGFAEVGTLTVPASGFERHAAVLLPYKTSWGLA